MLIRQTSDTHTEFFAKDQHKIPQIIDRDILVPLDTDKETTLILAGDIGSMHKPKCLEAFIDHVARRFKHVLYVPGNHEGYGGQMDTMPVEIKKMCGKHGNVFFNDKLLMVLEGVTFAGCTLWTDMNRSDPKTLYHAGGMMNDFRLIESVAGKRFQPIDHLALHVDHREFLEQSWEADVIFTHHLPSFKSVNPKYEGDLLNGAYASDLDELVLKKKPKYWFHGHTHDPVRYKIGDTQIICNPKGYLGERGISGYDPQLLLEV